MNITTSFGTVKIKMLKGEKGDQGEQGIQGEPFEFDDFTPEQLADLRSDVATVYYRKLEDTVYTTGTDTTTIEIPFADYHTTDMLFVNVEGLLLAEGVDYTISNGSIVLTEPITHHYTAVNFLLLTAIAMSTEDFDNLTGDIDSKIVTEVDAWLTAHPEATTTVLDNTVDDDKLVQTGGVLSRLNDLMGALYVKKNLVTEVLEGYVRSNNNGTVTAPWASSSYTCAVADVTEGTMITINFEWANNSFGFFANDSGNVIGRADANRDMSRGGYVYLVPEGATKLYFSYNTAGGTLQTYVNRGFVVLEGRTSINANAYNISRFGYGGDGIEVWADVLTTSGGEDLGTLFVLLERKIQSAPKTYRCLKDGTGDFTSLVTAINTVCEEENATLYVGDGTWDLIDELGSTYVESVSSSGNRGLVLKNGVHVICSSRAVITCKYEGSRAATIEWLSAFNSGVGGFTLENATIESDNVRYSVHDDRGEDTDQYVNKYINCTMKHTNGMYVQCIGGGFGIDGHIVVDGCHFTGDAGVSGTSLVSWHNSADGGWTGATPKGAKSFLEISGCYFENDGRVELIDFGSSEEISTALVHGNSFGASIYHHPSTTIPSQENINLIEWNNEIRS